RQARAAPILRRRPAAVARAGAAARLARAAGAQALSDDWRARRSAAAVDRPAGWRSAAARIDWPSGRPGAETGQPDLRPSVCRRPHLLRRRPAAAAYGLRARTFLRRPGGT